LISSKKIHRFEMVMNKLLACILVLSLLSPNLWADTAFTAPDGSGYCLGKQVLRVWLCGTRTVNGKSVTKYHEYECLLLGMIDKRFVVIPVLKDSDPKDAYTPRSLYMVNLGLDYKAYYNFLEQDRIAIDPSVEESLFMNRNSAFNSPHGQVLEWRFPISDVERKRQLLTGLSVSELRYILVTDQYSQRGFHYFFLQSDVGRKGIDALSLKYVGKIALPGPYADWIVTSLDAVDINPLVVSAQEKQNTYYPPALVVGVKQNDETGHDGLQLTVPKRILSCTLNQKNAGDEVKLTIHSANEFNLQVCHRGIGSKENSWDNVVGGGLLATNPSGGFSYYVATQFGRFYQSVIGGYGSTLVYRGRYAIRQDIHRLPVQYDAKAGAVVLGEKGLASSVSTDRAGGERGTEKGDIFKKYNADNVGPQMVFPDQSGRKEVYVRPHCWVAEDNAQLVGYYTPADANVLENINKELRIALPPELASNAPRSGEGAGPSPSPTPDHLVDINTNPSEAERRLVEGLYYTAGTQVLGVIYGWPISARAKNQPDGKLTDPSYTSSMSNAIQTSDSYGDGTSQTLEVGGALAKNVPFVGGSKLGIKGSWENKEETTKNQTVSLKIERKYARAQLDTETYYKTGLVISQSMVYSVAAMGRVTPSADGEPTLVAGASDRFLLAVSNIQSREKRAADFEMFQLEKPELFTIPESFENGENSTHTSVFSALTDGLTKRSSRIIIFQTSKEPGKQNDDFLNQYKAIRSAQESNGTDFAVALSKLSESGVTPYISTATDKSSQAAKDNEKNLSKISGDIGGAFKGSLNSSSTFTFNKLATEIRTTTWNRSMGITWDVTASGAVIGAYSKGEAAWKESNTRKYQTEESSGFTINQGGTDLAPGRYQTWFYVLSVNVPQMKSWMVKNQFTMDGKLYRNEAVKPGFVSTYCWKYNQTYLLFLPYLPQS